MRVIAGDFRGRPLKGPKHEGLRPTADRVKEALFNIIGARIVDAEFLDLFTGTGSVGIEALSRGAGKVVFCDRNPASIRLVRENLSRVTSMQSASGMDMSRIQVLGLPAERALELLKRESRVFDLIFLDPPFEAGLLPGVIRGIAERDLLKKDGWLILEHPRHSQIDLEVPGFIMDRTRYYGEIGLTFLQKDENLQKDAGLLQ